MSEDTAPILPPTEERVPRNTAAAVNERIQRQIEASVEYYGEHQDEIEARLRELDLEWDIERTLEANAAGIGLAGVILGSVVDRRWLAVPALVSGFLMQHAIQGWCPPVPLFRRNGVRTSGEIHQERMALKAIRGDFDDLKAQRTQPVSRLLELFRR